MKRQIERFFTPFSTVVLLLVFAVLAGCEKKREVYAVRGQDPAYQQELKGVADRKKRTARSYATLTAQMERLRARARAALPAGATDEQVEAELNANPAKYPGWKTLSAAFAEVKADTEKELADARRIVRRRIEKEAADRKAVAEGKAVVKPAASK